MRTKNHNYAHLIGKCVSSPKLSHQMKGADIYEFDVEIKRTSGYPDIINCHTTEKFDFKVGDYVEVYGILRSRDFDGKVDNYVFTHDVISKSNKDDVNVCEIEGYVASAIDYKPLSKGRVLSNFILASNELRRLNYTSILCWGLKAEWVKYMEKGTHLKLKGRIQSRDFTQANGTERRILELSVQELEVIEDEEI